MANIFVNGLNSKVGGGKTILNDYLKFLKNNNPLHNYFILTPNKEKYQKYATHFICIVDIKNFYKKSIFMPYIYQFLLDSLLKKLKIDVCFNFADIPIKTKKLQIFLFDWPYAIYFDNVLLKKMDLGGWLKVKIKLYFFKKNLSYIQELIVNTTNMKKRIKENYNIKNITVIPNFISSDNHSPIYKDFDLPKKGIKLLYITYYYPHKNIEIFLPLAQKIKQQNLDYKVIITIDANQHPKAKKILKNIETQKLDDIIINVGSIKTKNIASLYQQCDALLMPTLLECFSACYLEAMLHKLPVFTSDKDFAKDVCKDAAIYFNPLDANSILNQLNKIFKNKELKKKYIEKGIKRVREMPSNEIGFRKYNELIENVIK